MCIAEVRLGACVRRRPARGVGDHAQDVRVMVGWVCFMSRPEVENFSAPAVIATSASEYLTALEPADKYEVVGGRYIEAFAIHLFFFEHNALPESFRNGVRRVDHPEALSFLCFAPFEIARCSHQATENFAMVAAVQDDEPHSRKDTVVNAVDDVVGYFMMCQVSPPKQNIGSGQSFFRQTVLMFVEGCRFNREAGDRLQMRGNGTVDAVRIDAGDDCVLLLVPIFVPYNNTNIIWHVLRLARAS